MAVINDYVLSTTLRSQVKGGEVVAISGNFETAAADDITSIYRLCRVGANWIPLSISINCDALTGATDIDIGLYDTLEQGGAVKDKDCFLAGADISSGKALGSEQNGLASLPIDEIGDQMYEQAGDSAPTPNGEYDLCLTMNSEIAAAGTIGIRALFLVG